MHSSSRVTMTEFKKTMEDLDTPPPYEMQDVEAELTTSDIGPDLLQKLRRATIRAKEANDAEWETKAQEWKIKAKKEFMERFLSVAKREVKDTKESVSIEGVQQLYVNNRSKLGIKYKNGEVCEEHFNEAMKVEILNEFKGWGFWIGAREVHNRRGRDPYCNFDISWEDRK